MKYRESSFNSAIEQYRQYYKNINGGIDGYYEKTILEAQVYEVVEDDILAYFTVHDSRGLSSLVVVPEYTNLYSSIFDYVIQLPLFDKVLFTDKDLPFLKNVVRHEYVYEVQAYNFEFDGEISNDFEMELVTNKNHKGIISVFGDFIAYNKMDLNNCVSFYYKDNNEYVCFGALEALNLNNEVHCISMIVNEKYRNRNYGTKTVQFLIQYLQKKNLKVNARCYVKNEVSKRTLLKSGLHISNHLCKIEQL